MGIVARHLETAGRVWREGGCTGSRVRQHLYRDLGRINDRILYPLRKNRSQASGNTPNDQCEVSPRN